MKTPMHYQRKDGTIAPIPTKAQLAAQYRATLDRTGWTAITARQLDNR